MQDKPVLAISAGDVYGVGPEVSLKAFYRSSLFDMCRPVIHGPVEALTYFNDTLGLDIPLRVSADETTPQENVLTVVDTGGVFDPAKIGYASPEGGHMSLAAIRSAYDAVHRGDAHALVTAPISKEAIAMAGSGFRGHTDMLASFSGHADGAIMIMSSATLNVGLVTVHVPLKDVAALIESDRVLRIIRLGHHAMLQDFDIPTPRLAVLALNPHAGDGGYLGHEEEQVIMPVVRRAAAEGVRVEGPFPADGFFSAHNRQSYDLVIAMYHDQGLVPFKMQAKGRGVNVTSGLPFIRTSPDHGTAYQIAAQGRADAESMKEALYRARLIVLNRKKARQTA
jgi:4-hydroxythreonine-4-phosphate dehydrogenase